MFLPPLAEPVVPVEPDAVRRPLPALRDAAALRVEEDLPRTDEEPLLGVALFVAFEAPLRADFEAELRLADFLEAPTRLDLAALRLAVFLVAPPRLDLEADLDLEAARFVLLEADFLAPPRLADFLATLRLADFLVAPPRLDLEAVLDLEAARFVPFDADLLRLDLEALFDFEALFDLVEARFVPLEADLVPRDDLDADLDFPPFELLDAPLRLVDFLGALFFDDLPPERLLADFFDAAFLVDFAM